jgi:hypothetical protein
MAIFFDAPLTTIGEDGEENVNMLAKMKSSLKGANRAVH